MQGRTGIELVRAAALTGYFEVAEELGLNIPALMKRAGLSRAMLTNPEQPIPARSLIQLLEESAESSGCLTLGLRMAARRTPTDIGMMSLLVAHQATLRDALAVLSEYRRRLNSSLIFQFEEMSELTLLRQRIVLKTPSPSRQADDIATAVLEQVCRGVLGSGWKPVSVNFSYERPGQADLAVYRELFASPLEFGSEFDGIMIKTSDLDRANPYANPALAAHAGTLMAALVDPGERTFAEEVEQAISILLPTGRASAALVAKSLGVSTRSLQRRLDLKGSSFRELLDRVREREALRYLLQSRLPMIEISELLGYSAPPAFTRWFRERVGETPSQLRKRQSALKPGK